MCMHTETSPLVHVYTRCKNITFSLLNLELALLYTEALQQALKNQQPFFKTAWASYLRWCGDSLLPYLSLENLGRATLTSTAQILRGYQLVVLLVFQIVFSFHWTGLSFPTKAAMLGKNHLFWKTTLHYMDCVVKVAGMTSSDTVWAKMLHRG